MDKDVFEIWCKNQLHPAVMLIQSTRTCSAVWFAFQTLRQEQNRRLYSRGRGKIVHSAQMFPLCTLVALGKKDS